MKLLPNFSLLFSLTKTHTLSKAFPAVISPEFFECQIQLRIQGKWISRLLSVRRSHSNLWLSVGDTDHNTHSFKDFMEIFIEESKKPIPLCHLVFTTGVITVKFPTSRLMKDFKYWIGERVKNRGYKLYCTLDHKAGDNPREPKKPKDVLLLFQDAGLVIVDSKNRIVLFLRMEQITRASCIEQWFWFTTADENDQNENMRNFYYINCPRIAEIWKRLIDARERFGIDFPLSRFLRLGEGNQSFDPSSIKRRFRKAHGTQSDAILRDFPLPKITRERNRSMR